MINFLLLDNISVGEISIRSEFIFITDWIILDFGPNDSRNGFYEVCSTSYYSQGWYTKKKITIKKLNNVSDLSEKDYFKYTVFNQPKS